MPIYEYRCQHCGFQFEQLQKISDKPLKVCPNCQQPKLMKLVSNTSFQLKGSGWYATDFKNPSKNNKGDEKKKGKAAEVKAEANSSADSKEKSKPDVKDAKKELSDNNKKDKEQSKTKITETSDKKN